MTGENEAALGLAPEKRNFLLRASDKWDAMVERCNVGFGNSFAGRYFQIKERGSTLSTEMRAGTVTFLTMAYILAVNANILKDSGGPCNSSDCTGYDSTGQPLVNTPFCQFVPDQVAIENNLGFNSGYLACVEVARRSMISATSASALIASFLMGFAANLPLALAPGMGINAFFTYTVVGFFGTGGYNVTYGEALAAVFIEGWIFIIISVSGVRGKIIQLIPKSVMLATAGGIGLFLAFIGLQGSEGLGIVTYEAATLVTIGGCPQENRANQYTIPGNPTPSDICAYNNVTQTLTWNQGLGAKSSNYACVGKKMSAGTTWLGLMGGAIMVLLMGRNWRGAIMTGILFVTFVSWIPNTGASYLKANSAVPGGEARWEYFKQVVVAPNISATAVAWSWNSFGDPNLWAALISFLYLDFLDTTGTLFSMATFLDKSMPGFIDRKTKTFPRQVFAFCVDGFSIVVAALMGIAPLTVFIESATGIKEGGRTGLTAIMVSFYFFIALFFTPIISAIPGYATGPALIFVGALMMENILDIDWLDVGQAVPAFLTVALIPLTYSIAYGVIAGIGSYMFFYIWFLIYDLCASYWTGKPIKEILYEAIPEAFQKDKTSDADTSEEGKEVGEPEGKDEPEAFSKVYRTHIHDEAERASMPKQDPDSFSARAKRAYTDPPVPHTLTSPADAAASSNDKV